MITASRRSPQLGWSRRALLALVPDGRELYFWLKRLTDLLLGLAFLALLSPFVLLIALLVRLDSAGPVFFTQERMGFDWRKRKRRSFVIYKFRSMDRDCGEDAHKEYVGRWIHGELGAEDGVAKLANDGRVTRIGRILRKTSLDELPQLWNAIKGDMSLVGPRPVPLYEVAEYRPWQMQRLEATPGITGLWQVTGRGVVTADEMIDLDIEYIKRQTLWVDLKIMLLTVPAVMSGRGAV